MARRTDRPRTDRSINGAAFLAILLTALLMSAVLTRARAQTAPAPPAAAAEPATPENTIPVTPRSEAEAACRAIGNQERRAQCLAEIQPGGTRPGDTAPPPAELRPDKNIAPPASEGTKPN